LIIEFETLAGHSLHTVSRNDTRKFAGFFVHYLNLFTSSLDAWEFSIICISVITQPGKPRNKNRMACSPQAPELIGTTPTGNQHRNSGL